jgi:hypothetical protein
LSFAWEEDRTNGNKIWEKAILSCKDTQVLVIIGYSFPYYNKDIDTKILQAFSQLKRIYIQDPDFTNIQERIKEINIGRGWAEIEVLHRQDKKLFFIPNEL